ncbi:MAG: glycosyltransferase family 4 protein [Verrucomicrobiota bacterium]|nr:glycosyltransferase family 4 protein [Verrucomicrobiota bacterium]
MARASRIAFVCPRFAGGRALGGAEILLKNLAQRAAAAGRDVRFLTTRAVDHFTWANERPAGSRLEDGLAVTFFPVDARDVRAFLRIQEAISRERPVTADEEALWLANGVNSEALAAHLRRHEPEYDRIVLGPYLSGLVHAAAQVSPNKTILVPCLHDEPFAYLPAVARLFRGVSRIMFNSEPERDLAARLYGLDPSRASIVGMGLDPFTVAPGKAGLPRELRAAPYLIYCGRRETLKGTPLLIDYLAAFRNRSGRDVKLALTGVGQVDIPPGMAGHVLDMGLVEEERKRALMAGALAFCHPSVNESLSIVLLEAWLAGIPALVRAQSEVLRRHCELSNGGLWFRAYPEFEEELLMLMDAPALRRAMGDAGLAYARREYAWEKIERRLLEALDA